MTPISELSSLPLAAILRSVGEVAALVPQASADQLPGILLRVLEEARRISDLEDGTVSLFNDLASEIYVGRGEDEPSVHSVSEIRVPSGTAAPHRHGKARFPSTPSTEPPDSVRVFPLIASGATIGRLTISQSNGELKLADEQTEALKTLVNLAAIAIDRFRPERNSPELLPWLDAFAKVSAASHSTSGKESIDTEEITDNVLRISGASFVVLYEYFKEKNDVQLPPTVSGLARQTEILVDRGMALPHEQSTVFNLLNGCKPFYAEAGASDWVDAGLMSNQTAHDPRGFFVREGVASSAGIPLFVEMEPVGVLFLNYRRKKHFEPSFRKGLELFAHQAALAIGNKRFFLRSARISKNLGALNQLGRELSAAMNLDIAQIGKLLDDHTRMQVSTRNFFLCLYDPETDHFTLPYIRDHHDSRETLEPRLNEGLTGLVCRSREVLLLTRKQQNEIFQAGMARLVGEASAIWLGAPLLVRNEVIGAVVIQDYEDESRFNEEHRQLLSAIAAQAAIAIDNHRLLHGAQLQLEELATLLALSEASSSGSLTNAPEVSSILDKLCSYSGADGSLILLIDQGAKDTLRVRASSSSLEGFLNKAFKRGEGVSGRVLQKREPWIINDYHEWSGRVRFIEPAPNRVCAVPLMVRDEIVGVITLSSNSATGEFGRREIEILQRFAGPLSAAIQNSRHTAFRQTLIDAGPYAIVAVDRRGRITEFNLKASALFEYSRSELEDASVAKLYTGGLEEARRIHSKLLERPVIRDEETSGISKTGQRIPLSLSAALLKDGGGEIIGSVGIMEDLRLQSLRTRTQLLVEALREISDEEDLDSIATKVVNSTVTLLYADASCLLLQKDDEFQVASALGLDRDVTTDVMSDIAREFLRETALVRPPITVFPFEAERCKGLRLREDSQSSVLVPIHTEHRFLAFLLVESRQEGHFKGDPQLLRVLASQAAVSINRVQLLRFREKTIQSLQVAANAIAVGQIATTFMHEARNSLNSINLVAKNLSEAIAKEMSLKKQNSYLKELGHIEDEISRFGQLAQRLQRFTHLGLGPVKAEVHFNSVVQRTLQLLGSTLRQKKMKVETRLDPSLDEPSGKGGGNPINVDEHQIQQVLMNLILNSVAASSERQPLIIETRNLVDRVECVIQDRGSGISQEAREHLFEPFFTTKKDGVGLGLYLSRILVEENHGGSIEIGSGAIGRGAIFCIRIPKTN